MSQSTEPLRIPSRVEQGANGGVLIGRVLKRAGIPDGVISAVVDLDSPRLMPIRAALIDATCGRPALTRIGATVFHVLWCKDEPNAFVRAGLDAAGKPVQHRIGPGDTIYVPPGCPIAIGPGILGYEISSPVDGVDVGSAPSSPAPTHGLERFEGYNRRTVCAAGPTIVLERWKLTQPHFLSWPEERSLFVTNLVRPMAIVWDGGSDLIGRAESRLLPPGLRSSTYIPDGLGYLLVCYVPDLLADVVTPLRAAGHTDVAIAMLGDVTPALTQAVPAFEAGGPRRSAPAKMASARSVPDAPETSGKGT